jgi:hypothetical protein
MKRLLLVLIIATAAAVTFVLLRTGNLTPVLARLPSDNAAVLAIDFAALRGSGVLALLSGPIVEEEPEYKTFVEKTGFDYRRDLDHAFISFPSDGVYFLIRGRFDWRRLESYAREQGGGCLNGLCRMAGSQPSRKISYFLIRPDLLAMAVSPNESAATRMSEPAKNARPISMPKQPVWLSLPSSTLKRSADFPTGTQLFAKAMQDAESATISIAPRGKALEAQLEVVCRNANEASVLAAQFQKTTDVLREILKHEKQSPGPGELAGVLTAGVFQQQDARVVGRWPIEKAFLDNLAKQ